MAGLFDFRLARTKNRRCQPRDGASEKAAAWPRVRLIMRPGGPAHRRSCSEIQAPQLRPDGDMLAREIVVAGPKTTARAKGYADARNQI